MNIDENMREYIKGFEAGCNFIVREIELYSQKHTSLVLDNLLKHLTKDIENDNQTPYAN
jgi:hypothetical protein